MVYDPIRDCEVPSPATTSHADPWRSDHGHTPSSLGRDTHSQGNERFPPPPPAFSHAQGDRSPTSSSSGNTPHFRSVSGGGGGSSGLRGLLNNSEEDGLDAPNSRRSSAQDARSSFSSIPEDGSAYQQQQQQHQSQRQHPQNQHQSYQQPQTHLPHRGSASAPAIRQLLNSEEAPPLSKSSSASSLGASAHQSPAMRTHQLDPDGFLAPSTPASAYPRNSRSPHPFIPSGMSPGYPTTPLPADWQGSYQAQHDAYQTPLHSSHQSHSESSRSKNTQPTPQDQVEYHRMTPQLSLIHI